MLLLPTLNPPSARRTLRGADFRGISRYITIIIRSIILGDEKGAARRRGRRKLFSPPLPPPRLRALSFPRLSCGKLAWLRLGSTQPIFDNSRSFHRDSHPLVRIIRRSYVFRIDLIAHADRPVGRRRSTTVRRRRRDRRDDYSR